MSIFEFDQETYIKVQRKETMEDGIQLGMFQTLDHFLASDSTMTVAAAAKLLGFNEQDLASYVEARKIGSL